MQMDFRLESDQSQFSCTIIGGFVWIGEVENIMLQNFHQNLMI
jgi:hypothetical protein